MINEHDQKTYRFELRSVQQTELYCEYENYERVREKSFVYFIRTDRDSSLNQMSTMDDIDSRMKQIFLYGFIPVEQPLIYLKSILPFFQRPNLSKNIDESDRYLIDFHRFSSQIDSIIRQVQGEFRLIVPMTNDDNDEEFVVEHYESILSDWEKLLHEQMNNELHRRANDSSPLGELEFWHERSIRISSILEEMNRSSLFQRNSSTIVKKNAFSSDEPMRIVGILRELESPTALAYLNIKSQLENDLLEASDNYKFLSTVERHLKTLQLSNELRSIIDILPNLLQGLKTIW